MIGFDGVVHVLLRDVTCGGYQFFDHSPSGKTTTHQLSLPSSATSVGTQRGQANTRKGIPGLCVCALILDRRI
ncbi:MAG: hypothetical protein ACRDSH_10285 [Pseudonocardiaceae bacterium]